MSALDKQSMVPLYIQLAGNIEEDIRTGKYRPGSKIPSEAEYMEMSGVSRVTVRQAMRYLLTRNLIVRRRGLGTFIQREGVKQSFDELFGLYPSLLRKGRDLHTEILSYKVVSPDPEVRLSLQLSAGEKILRFVRQFWIENEVLVVSQMHVPFSLASRWSKEEAAIKNSFRLLEEHAGVRVSKLLVKIKACAATAQTGEWLKVPRKSPVLELRRLAFELHDKPVEYTILTFRGESYELTTQISAEKPEQFRLGKSAIAPDGTVLPGNAMLMNTL